MKRITIIALLLATFSADSFSQVDSFSLYFRSGISALSTSQKQTIDSLAKSLLTASSTIRITGYADEPGTLTGNKILAEQRALVVEAALGSAGVAKSRLAHAAGTNNMRGTGENAVERRVDIVVTNATQPKTLGPLSILATMNPDEVVELKNLLFSFGTADILPQSFPVLKELYEVLQANPKLKIRLEGHVCCGLRKDIGQKPNDANSVSVARPKAVIAYLLARGISQDRLSYVGLGFSNPKIYPERNTKDELQNRRVEIRVVSNK